MALPTIRQGYSGMETQQLRSALESYGFHPSYAVTNPNLFDSWVDAAVRAFQAGSGLKVDGIVGPNTWGALLGQSLPPATTPAQPAQPSTPVTQSDPGLVTPPVQTALPVLTAKTKDNMMMGLSLVLAAGVAWWIWRGSRKGGMTLAGLPFGARRAATPEEAEARAEERAEKQRAKRRLAQRLQRIDMELGRELKRRDLPEDPERAPKEEVERLTKLIGKGIEAEDRALERAPRGQTVRNRFPEAGYKREHTRIGRSLHPSVTPSIALRNRTRQEDDAWLERVESGKSAAQATKRIVVRSKQYQADAAYRESEQADARAKAEASKAEVRLVNEHGVTLYRYQPNIRNFKDVTSERLIEAVERDAKAGNCPKAVRALYKVRPLALDAKTEAKLDSAAKAVAYRCPDELRGEADERAELRGESERLTRTHSSTLRELTDGRPENSGLVLYKRKHKALTPEAIREAVRRGELTAHEGQELVRAAKDEAERNRRRGIQNEPARGTAKYIRRRRGERDAHVYTSPSGAKRTLRK